MRAARLVSRRKIDFLEIPDPDPIVDEEVKIKVEEISICGSDIYLEYDADLPEEQYPLTAGAPSHECVGTVVESRDPSYKVGQRVIVIPRDVAGMQEYLVQTKDKLIKIIAKFNDRLLDFENLKGKISDKKILILAALKAEDQIIDKTLTKEKEEEIINKQKKAVNINDITQEIIQLKDIKNKLSIENNELKKLISKAFYELDKMEKNIIELTDKIISQSNG